MLPYDILGVAPDASDEDIKAAYRRLAMQLHPDRGGTTEAFQRLEEAYRTLCNPEARAAIDELAHLSDEEREAAQTLEGLFETMLRQGAVDNLVAASRQHLQGGRAMLGQQITEARAQLRQMLLAKGRVKFDPKASQLRTDLVARQLERRLQVLRERLATAEREARICDLTIQMLEAFADMPDPANPTARPMPTGTFTGQTVFFRGGDFFDLWGGRRG